MSFTVKIPDPVVGNKLKVEFSWPGDFKMVAHEEDVEGARYVIVFFDPVSGNPAGSDEIETTIDHVDRGPEHSVTAIVVQGNKVVAKDRKLVRDGRRTEA